MAYYSCKSHFCQRRSFQAYYLKIGMCVSRAWHSSWALRVCVIFREQTQGLVCLGGCLHVKSKAHYPSSDDLLLPLFHTHKPPTAGACYCCSAEHVWRANTCSLERLIQEAGMAPSRPPSDTGQGQDLLQHDTALLSQNWACPRLLRTHCVYVTERVGECVCVREGEC